MRISDWSSDVCSSDLLLRQTGAQQPQLIGEAPPQQGLPAWFAEHGLAARIEAILFGEEAVERVAQQALRRVAFEIHDVLDSREGLPISPPAVWLLPVAVNRIQLDLGEWEDGGVG